MYFVSDVYVEFFVVHTEVNFFLRKNKRQTSGKMQDKHRPVLHPLLSAAGIMNG